MASIGHIALGMAAGRRYSRGSRKPVWALLAMAGFSLLSMLPDGDIVAFKLGIPYHAPLGHRGAAHSLLVALCVGALVGLGAWALRRSAWRVALYSACVVASHGLLDMLTDGGLGVAWLWPFSARRFFLPWRPIPVAPIAARFFTARGLYVALAELAWFAPLLIYALWPRREARVGEQRAGADPAG